MGGSSVPSSTSQYQQLATGIWGSPQATKLALPILKPALANIKEQQEMLLGFQKGDPTQTRKFFGLPTDAPPEEITRSIASRTRGPQIQMPQVQAAQQAPQQPIKTAAQGGIMALGDMPQRDPRRGFAPGGSTVRSLTPQQRQTVLRISRAIEEGTATDAQKARLDKIEKSTGLNVSPFSDTGTGVPKNPAVAEAVSTAATAFQATPEGKAPAEIQAAAAQAGLAPANAYLGQAGSFGTSIEKVRDPVTGEMVDKFNVTNPYYNQAINTLQGMNTQPAQFGQATQAYNDAIAGLSRAAEYGAKDVAAQRADVTGYDPAMAQAAGYQATSMEAPQDIAAQGYDAATMQAANVQRARDINAPTARAESYQASTMNAPQEVRAQGYDAAQMKASTMQGAQDIATNKLQQYQMDRDRIRNLQAQRAQVAEMSGPETWAQAGVAEKYMNPYVKTALQAQRDIANRAYAQDLQRTKAEATGKGAFGGSRTQLALMQQRMNQDLASRATESQALAQAYTQGMGQFTGEQQMGQAAKQANQAASNAANLDYMARQLAAQQANQGMDYNTALQNMQAKLGVQQAQQQADLTAAQANQMYGYGGFQSQAQNLAALNNAAQQNMQAINQQRSQAVTQALQAAQANQQAALTTEQQNMIARNAANQFNAQNATQISQANAQMSLAAQQSNQATDLSTNQANAQLQQQAAQANQNAINQQRSQFVTQQLEAAKVNYGGQLTAAQQNQIAANAVGQFNASNQQQINLANQASQNAAGQFNAGAQNQAGLQFAQQNLQGQMANQQAGLQANQQNIGALSQAAGAAQGLGSLGTQVGGYNANLANLWGQAGGVLQGLGQAAYGQQQQNAANIFGGPTTLANQGVGAIGGMGGGQQGVVNQAGRQG